jgi:chemotaxis protein CheX
MKVEIINPFVQAATDVLDSELGREPRRGEIRVQRTSVTTDEVTTLVGVSGGVSGLVMISMSQATAIGLASKMLGQDCHEFDALAQSGIGELGNVITGRAAVLLSEAGYASSITPPALVIGKGTMIATLDLNQLVIPLRTEVGSLEIQVVIKAAPTDR